MDEIGIPEDKAWEIFKPFVIKRMMKGVSKRNPQARAQVIESVENRSKSARKSLLDEMELRPIIYSRAPVLHKYGMIGGYAHPVKGNAIRVSPIIEPGMNADHDGDTFNYHVVISDEAIKDVKENMLPSRHLFSVADFKLLHQPGHGFNMGLYLLNKGKKKGRMVLDRKFKDRKSVLEAYKRGELNLNDEVKVG